MVHSIEDVELRFKNLVPVSEVLATDSTKFCAHILKETRIFIVDGDPDTTSTYPRDPIDSILSDP